MRIAKRRTIFSNAFNSDRFEAIKRYLIAEGENPSDFTVLQEMEIEEQTNWEIAVEELEHFITDIANPLILMGNIGRWNGNYARGFIFSSLDELRCVWQNEDYIEIYDENGHLYIQTSNHDGNSFYEVKILTDRGWNYFENWACSWDARSEKEVHTKLFTDSHYTVLPHFTHKIYGSKKGK